jgi:hypothetical protein
MAGDWNMVTRATDNSHTVSRVASASEQLAFTCMISHLEVEDFFSETAQLKYSWDNRRRMGPRKMKRLDRIYWIPYHRGAPASHILQYEILGDSVLSDHLLVVLSLEVQPATSCGSCYKVNGRYLQDKEVVDQLIQVWRAQPLTLSFFGKSRRLIKWYKVFCRNRTQEQKAAETTFRQELVLAHQRLEADPDDINAQTALATTSESLQELKAWKMACQKIPSRVK